MNEYESIDCGAGMTKGRERVRWRPKQLVTADDLTQDQRYWREKLRRHNRLMHGWGVVCGLVIEHAIGEDGIEIPWTVTIGPGYALDPYGDEIVVEQQTSIDLRRAWSSPVGAAGPCTELPEPWCIQENPAPPHEQPLYLAIRCAEYEASPVRAPDLKYGCEENRCEYTRILDGYSVQLRSSLPSHYQIDSYSMFHACNESCLPCPEEPWVLLANISLEDKGAIIIGFQDRLFAASAAKHRYACMPPRQGTAEEHAQPHFPYQPTYYLGYQSFFELGKPISAPFASVAHVIRADGSRALVPVDFTANPEGTERGETVPELLDREGDRQFFDPKVGRVYTLRELLSRADPDPETRIISITDILNLLNDLRLEDPSFIIPI